MVLEPEEEALELLTMFLVEAALAVVAGWPGVVISTSSPLDASGSTTSRTRIFFFSMT